MYVYGPDVDNTGGTSGKRSKLQASPSQCGCTFAPPLSMPSMRTLRVGLAAPTRIPNRSETQQSEYRSVCVRHSMSALCLVTAFLEPAVFPHHVRVATTTRHPFSVVIATGRYARIIGNILSQVFHHSTLRGSGLIPSTETICGPGRSLC